MPWVPAAGCRERGCPERAVARGWCARHDRGAWAGAGRPMPAGWTALRRACLERDGYRCRLCGSVANQADHIIARSEGGANELGNLRALCDPCHRKVTGAQGGRAPRRS